SGPGLALLGLRVEVAERIQAGGHNEDALARARKIWGEVEADPKRAQPLRAGIVAIFSEDARRKMSVGESRAAVDLLSEALAVDPTNSHLRYQAVLAMAVLEEKVAFEMLE